MVKKGESCGGESVGELSSNFDARDYYSSWLHDEGPEFNLPEEVSQKNQENIHSETPESYKHNINTIPPAASLTNEWGRTFTYETNIEGYSSPSSSSSENEKPKAISEGSECSEHRDTGPIRKRSPEATICRSETTPTPFTTPENLDGIGSGILPPTSYEAGRLVSTTERNNALYISRPLSPGRKKTLAVSQCTGKGIGEGEKSDTTSNRRRNVRERDESLSTPARDSNLPQENSSSTPETSQPTQTTQTGCSTQKAIERLLYEGDRTSTHSQNETSPCTSGSYTSNQTAAGKNGDIPYKTEQTFCGKKTTPNPSCYRVLFIVEVDSNGGHKKIEFKNDHEFVDYIVGKTYVHINFHFS
jgi:hypothetical protein